MLIKSEKKLSQAVVNFFSKFRLKLLKETAIMQTVRAFGLFILSAGLIFSALSLNTDVQAQERLVEQVDIQGNRRQRDEDLLYYIKTRPGDTFSQAQVERDLQELLSLNFFDKTSTRVLVEDGVRGGVNVIFEVRELPIIRDLQFEGLKAVQESDVLKAFRENRVGISKEAIYDPVKVRNATRILKELLSAKGFPNAKITVSEEEVSATSVAVTFNIDQGERSRIVKIEFEGNEVFKDGELRGQLKLVKETGLISRFTQGDILDRRKLEYDLRRNVDSYMQSKGYLQARTLEPRVEGLGRKRTGFFLPLPLLSSKDDALRVVIPVNEGKIFRVGDVKIEGNSIVSEQIIQAALGLQKGQIVDGKKLREGLFENLKKYYETQGFVQYTAELNPEFKENPANPNEGIVDIGITIEEGKQFTLRRLEFVGNTFTRDNVLRREFLLNEGDIYNQQLFEYSVVKLNQTGYFDPIDKDKDVERRTNEEEGTLDAALSVKERGRQQISFNGGISGIGGSFFGLEYTTNNLLGRGESFSLQFGVGNRQSSFQLSFTEPYFRDRPISIGFSLFGYTRKFFGEGTFLSQNTDAQLGALTTLGLLQTDESNLFTQNSYGATLFASAPLSEFYRKRRFTQFSRVGLSYQFSATTIKDPPVNADASANSIPVIFRQPNIFTSRITPTFVYDSRNYSGEGIDPVSGRQITFSLAFSGLGGDVRTYQPSLSYIQFIPMRRKKSKNPEVLGFRFIGGTIGSFATTDKIRNANSLSFVDGVPIFERYFLGDEFTIRGYNTRSIGPVAPVETYVSSRNVIVAYNATGTPVVVSNLSQRDRDQIAQLGTFTGVSGSNSTQISRNVQFIGADTQLLGNLEYRIPIFGPLSLAAFADVGTAFNRSKGDTVAINSNFLPDQPFLGFNSLSSLVLNKNPQFQTPAGYPFFANGALLLFDNRPITRGEFQQLLSSGTPINPQTGLPLGVQQVYLRGEAQTNTIVKVGESAFNKFSDYRASLGFEVRVQVPVVNVPFRLIYAYNPNARFGTFENLPGLFFSEKRNVFRFSVGRTF
jgi:outer membrane protein insertion porin family